jgi:hypothetical protein
MDSHLLDVHHPVILRLAALLQQGLTCQLSAAKLRDGLQCIFNDLPLDDTGCLCSGRSGCCAHA